VQATEIGRPAAPEVEINFIPGRFRHRVDTRVTTTWRTVGGRYAPDELRPCLASHRALL
jgi:hypothetical protein